MESFYIIVITIAIICLILTLTVIGIILTSQTTAVTFPPTQNTCPDYWTVGTDMTGNVICNVNPMNVGIYACTTASGGYKIDPSPPGYTSGKFDFSDPGWATTYTTTNQCALHKWTNQNNISWDGVSNYNGC